MNATIQAHITRLESDNEDLRASNARLQTLCTLLAHENGQQEQELARLRAAIVVVPKLGTLNAAKQIPQPVTPAQLNIRATCETHP
jgi:hypothetical protein